MQSADNMYDSAALADSVRALMERRGIPKRRQCKELTHILQLSFSQAHRKLTGISPWTLDQLRKISDHFHEPLSMLNTVAGPGPGNGSGSDVRGDGDHGGSAGTVLHDALFVVGGRELPCSAWIGAPVSQQYRADFVALEQEGLWRVLENTPHLTAPGQRYQVDKVHIDIQQPHLPAIAVIDDDRHSADNLRDYLNETGFRATAFYQYAALDAAMQETDFDGYVVDWLLGTSTTEQLIRSIRQSGQSSAPIILLTGQLITGKASESDVARVIMQFNVNCQEKPTRLSIIAAELSKALNQG